MGLISRVSSRTYREKMVKIPFLSGKWSPKKTPPRRSQSLNNLVNLDDQQRQREFGIDAIDTPPQLRLQGGPALRFENGKWTTTGTGNEANQDGIADSIASHAASAELIQSRSDVKRLTEENNMLKMKVEILLDMLTEVVGQKNSQQMEQEAVQRQRATYA